MTMVQPGAITPAAAPAPDGPPPSRSDGAGFWRRFRRQRMALVSLGFLVLVVVGCAAASLVAPYGAAETDFTAAGKGPSGRHWLGTDSLGRDVLSRLLYGGQHTLTAVAVALLVTCAIGVPAGVTAGYLGGRTDRIVSTVSDGMLALPSLILLLAVLAIYPHNTIAAMITFGILVSAGLTRVVRAGVLGVRGEQYIDAARVSGLSEPAIIRRHVLSKVVAPVVVQLTLLAGVGLITETGLGYLGLGPQPPTPTWGSLVGDASSVIQQQPWLLVPTGGTVGLTVLACGLLGDGIRDAVTERWTPAARTAGTAAAAAPPGRGDAPAPDAALPDAALPDAALPDAPVPGAGPGRGDAALQVRELTVAFGPQVVVRGVSFAVAPGETVALVGESGCGKTVTVRAAMGLLPPGGGIVGGQVCLGDTPIASADRVPDNGIRGRRLAMISQEPMVALDPSLRVGRLLAESVRRHAGLARAAARQRAEELLGQVGIPDPGATMRRYPHELSGGMAQRVAIARALSGSPEVLIADEPTTALDVTVQAEVLDLLRRLQAETGLAIVLVTHDWGVVADSCDRCVVMYAGEVVEEGPVDEVFAAPLHPYTRGLLASSPERSVPGTRLQALPGRVPMPAEWPAGCHFAARCPLARDECSAGPVALLAPAPDRSSRCLRVAELAGAGHE